MSEHIARKPVKALYCSCNSCLSILVSFCHATGLSSVAPNLFFPVPQKGRNLGNSIYILESEVLAMLPVLERQAQADSWPFTKSITPLIHPGLENDSGARVYCPV